MRANVKSDPSAGSQVLLPNDTPESPHPHILRLMNNLGIETSKVCNAIINDSYDNFHAIYLLLLERLKTSLSLVTPSPLNGGANASGSVLLNASAAKRRQSDAPRSRPPLNTLRDHSTFQTTDCIPTMPINSTYAVGSSVVEFLMHNKMCYFSIRITKRIALQH